MAMGSATYQVLTRPRDEDASPVYLAKRIELLQNAAEAAKSSSFYHFTPFRL